MYVVGVDAMRRMSTTRVLLSGLGGLGCEIAKNLILSGVASVTLHDVEVAKWEDLSSNFFLGEEDVGKSRTDGCLSKLRDLNQYVEVTLYQGELTAEFLQHFQVAIFVNRSSSELVHLNALCREKGVHFVAAESRGLFGSLFCDFGCGFKVADADGEEPVTCLVTSVTASNPAALTVHDENRHNLEDGVEVMLSDIEGPASLNGRTWSVKVTGPFTFTIPVDTSAMPAYVRGGFVKPLKSSVTVDFYPLSEQLRAPSFPSDVGELRIQQQLHCFYRALHSFLDEYGRPPAPHLESEAVEVVNRALDFQSREFPQLPLDTERLKSLAKVAGGNLNPMAAFLGGMASQEVLKACTGKFTPVQQFFHFDSGLVPPDLSQSLHQVQPQGSRYDGQLLVFGADFQKKLECQKNFVVGAGALGCELLKNFALMGIGCSPEGLVAVTDMDTIEKSNLSRQFLFRAHHIRKEKSLVAAQQARLMNPRLNVKAFTDKVEAEPFDDDFWDSLDGVTNALDNVQARLYVDSKCVYHRKPLVDSGTLGTKGNVQVVCPYQSESYASSRDPPEKQIPVCTLKNFPNAIEHTIQWARDSFEGLFCQAPADANNFLKNPEFLKSLERDPANRISTLENILEALVRNTPKSIDDCVAWARFKFEEYFNQQIEQMLYNFPLGSVTSSGEKFWSGPKRPPTPLKFDSSDNTHVEFIRAATCLRAQNYNITVPDGFDFAKQAQMVEVPVFVPRKAHIQVEEKEEKPETRALTHGQSAQELMGQLPQPRDCKLLSVIEFEKDDDTNFHIDFITACSNLRARNYKIPEVDRSKTKQIAGKIIPAMVTTTALVTGLVCFEWYKLIQGKELAELRNSFVNLAIPLVASSEPLAPAVLEYGDVKWSLWDRFDVDVGRDMTLQEFIDYFEEKHRLEISMVSCGPAIIYSFFGAKDKLRQRLVKPVSEVVQEITKTELPANQKYINLEICCAFDGDDVDVPSVRYRFRYS
eukprot:NODE_111_length_3228_cov_56.356087_g101_i0.p1 GENE.NODE_111_length_3228_cov_56.356087_g101_i0~~NODE_111_length_3228_cov_56.356087_g101_i0.p1  ORF type:complete len:984 (+),score=189.48 NODE_111_length_3228_cov_56.356087_g101_i0:150-3101(+)